METETIKQHNVSLKEIKEKLDIKGRIRYVQLSLVKKGNVLDDEKTTLVFKETEN